MGDASRSHLICGITISFKLRNSVFDFCYYHQVKIKATQKNYYHIQSTHFTKYTISKESFSILRGSHNK